MQRFKYLTVYINSSGAYQTSDGTSRNIQELGEQGWDLVESLIDLLQKLIFAPLGRVFKLWKDVSVAVASLRASAFGHKTWGFTDDLSPKCSLVST
jgi:hypothetical protein